MPCSPLFQPSPSSPDSEGERPFEPALSQLRQLSLPELERLVRAWLLKPARITGRRFRFAGQEFGSTTFHLLLDALPLPLSLPLRVRIHQRRSRLQVHHVEAFAGHLVRTGVSAGVLVTTGDITPEALRVAAAYVQPRIYAYSGAQWITELASHRLGLQRKRLWRWVLVLQKLFGNDGSRMGGAL